MLFMQDASEVKVDSCCRAKRRENVMFKISKVESEQ